MSLRPLARSPWLVPSLGLLALCLAAPHVLYAEPAQDGVKTADAGPQR